MENELVNKIKKDCTLLENKAYNAFTMFQEKGIELEDLDELRDSLSEAQLISLGTNNNNAEAMKKKLNELEKTVDAEIASLKLELSTAVSEKELKKDYFNTQKSVGGRYAELKKAGYTASQLETLAIYYNQLYEEYGAINSDNTYLMSKKLEKKKELIEDELNKFDKNLEDTREFVIPIEASEEEEIPVKNCHEPEKNSGLHKYLIGGVCGAALISFLQFSGCSPIKSIASIFGFNGEKTQEVDTPDRNAEIDTDATDENLAEFELADTQEAEQQAPALNPGEYGTFVDASDDEQVYARAVWYYDKYLKDTEGLANAPTVEDIENAIRMYNGEFKKDSYGKVTYNEQNIIESAIEMHTIANYDSLANNDTLQFTPLAPLFLDGSLAQKGAQDLDNIMIKVVEAINNKDDMAFVEASQEWGTAVLYMFEYVDFNGKYVNYSQVDAPTSFALYHAMRSKYASTILEYGEKHGIDICIPYCVHMCTEEPEDIALSELLYRLEERSIDAVAVRSGHLEEYEANNLTLPQDLLAKAKNYFNSKYELEVGYTKKLN